VISRNLGSKIYYAGEKASGERRCAGPEKAEHDRGEALRHSECWMAVPRGVFTDMEEFLKRAGKSVRSGGIPAAPQCVAFCGGRALGGIKRAWANQGHIGDRT